MCALSKPKDESALDIYELIRTVPYIVTYKVISMRAFLIDRKRPQ